MTTEQSNNTETADNDQILEEVASPSYPQEELAEIFDSLLFTGGYEETVTIRNKLKVVFRSRSAAETSEISQVLDAKKYQLASTFIEQRALWNLAYSLVSYNGTKAPIDPKDKYQFVARFPAHVVSVLSSELVKFDAKVEAACKTGEENF